MEAVALLQSTALGESAFELRLGRPPGFSFQPGQSIRVYAGDEGRDYSLTGASSAGDLRLLVRRIQGGAVSPALVGLRPGAAVRFSGPHGVFTLTPSSPQEPRRPVVLVGTGVGIAPFLSMVRSGASGFTFLHGARSEEELFYRKELETAAARYVPCLSRRHAPGCFPGRVTEWARAELPSGVAFDFYLCGGRRMVRDMIVLIDERLPGSRVFTEIFY